MIKSIVIVCAIGILGLSRGNSQSSKEQPIATTSDYDVCAAIVNDTEARLYLLPPAVGTWLILHCTKAATALPAQSLERLARKFEESYQYPIQFRLSAATRRALAMHLEVALERRGLRRRIAAHDLRADILTVLAAHDPNRARQLLEQSLKPQALQLSTCQLANLQSSGGFGPTIKLLMERAFTQKEISEGKRISFFRLVVDYLFQPESGTEITSALMIEGLTPEESDALRSAWIAAVLRWDVGDRDFVRSMSPTRVRELIASIGTIPSEANRLEMLRAYRQYIIKQIVRPRCSDDFDENGSDISIEAGLRFWNALGARLSDPVTFAELRLQSPTLKASDVIDVDMSDTYRKIDTANMFSALDQKMRRLQEYLDRSNQPPAIAEAVGQPREKTPEETRVIRETINDMLGDLKDLRGDAKSRAELDGLCSSIAALVGYAIEAGSTAHITNEVIGVYENVLSNESLMNKQYDLWVEYMAQLSELCFSNKDLKQLCHVSSRDASAQVGVVAAVLLNLEK